jgi:hypothetical protein
MKKIRLRIRSKKIKELLIDGGRKNAKDDFFELLRRAVHPR